MGQKYGFRPLPSKIATTEFEQLLDNLTDHEERNLLGKWFVCDKNAVPAIYVLQPVSSQIPGYLSQDPGQRQRAIKQWNKIFAQLQKIVRRGAKRLFGDQDGDNLRKYFISGNFFSLCLASLFIGPLVISSQGFFQRLSFLLD